MFFDFVPAQEIVCFIDSPSDQISSEKQEILTLLNEKFQGPCSWEDTGKILRLVQEQCNEKKALKILSAEEKEKVALKILESFMQKKTLPKFDLLGNHLLPGMTKLMMSSSAPNATLPQTEEIPDDASIFRYTDQCLEKFRKRKTQENWLFEIGQFSIQFAETFALLSKEERCVVAKKVLDRVIDKTDTPYVPDLIFDPIFKRVAHAVIDEILDMQYSKI